MKKNLIYAGMLLLGVTVATSCSNEESLEQVVNNGKTIEAVIENAAEARTSVNDSYQVTWTAGDAFSIWNGQTKAATLTLSEGEGTTSGKFTIDDADLTITEDMVALFPTSNNLSYTFATSYDSQETDAPMLGSFAEGKFTFSLLTAMVRVVVANVPAGDVSMTISSGDNGEVLTGEATLNDGTLSVLTEGQTSVSVNFKTEEAGTLTFDVPVPVQNYTNGLSVVVKSDETEVLNKTTNAFNAEKGKIYVFGATYISTSGSTEEVTEALQEALNEGGAIVLEEGSEEVNVSSLTIPAEITATLDLGGNTLVLGGTEGRATSTIGITNRGELTLTSGSITFTGTSVNDAAIYNLGVLSLNDVTVTSNAIGVYNKGTWEDGKKIQDYKYVDATVKFMMEAGSVTSTSTATDVNVYAVMGNDFGLIDIKNATIGGAETSTAGGLSLNCAVANLENVTINRAGTAHQAHVVAGILNYDENTEITNHRYYYGSSQGEYGYAVVNGIYYGEVNTAVVFDEDGLIAVLSNIENNAVVKLGNNVSLTKQLTFNNADKTLTLDLDNKTLSLKGTYGLVNRGGKLVIKNGNISGDCSYATLCNWSGTEAIETRLETVELTASYIGVYNKGTWEDGKKIQDYKDADATVKFTMEDGSVTSTSTAADVNVYAVMGNDFGLIDIKNATIGGAETSTAGGLSLNCAVANLENVTINRAGTAHQAHVVAGILNYDENTEITNHRYYYGSSQGQYGYAEVNGTLYGEVNTVVTPSTEED